MASLEHPGITWRDLEGPYSIYERFGNIQKALDGKLNPTGAHLGGIWQHLAGPGTHQGHQM